MLKIAICDDEKVFRDNINKYVAAYLNEKEISYEIDTFSSGKEIIDLGIEIKQYNIIFLDINMDDALLSRLTATSSRRFSRTPTHASRQSRFRCRCRSRTATFRCSTSV